MIDRKERNDIAERILGIIGVRNALCDAFLEYADHKESCDRMRGKCDHCTCGYDELVEEIKSLPLGAAKERA